MRKSGETADAKFERLKQQRVQLLKERGVFARAKGKAAKALHLKTIQVNRSSAQNEAEKKKAHTSKEAAEELEKTAKTFEKMVRKERTKSEKVKRKAQGATKEENAEKRKKATELSELIAKNLILRQINIDVNQEKDIMLTQFAGCNNVIDEYAHFSTLFQKNRMSRKGGRKKRLLKLLQLILECIVSGAPPSAIRFILLIFAQTFNPTIVIEAIPCILYICQCRSILLTVTKTLAALR